MGVQPLPKSKLLVPARQSSDGVRHEITPQSAGWTYVGFESREIGAGKHSALNTGTNEVCVVVLSGRVRVTTGEFDSGMIGERADVFSGLPWSVYLPPHHDATIVAESDSEVALCSAPAV